MSLLPPPPSWDGLHPLVIHFPIALLLVAPLLIVVSLWAKSARAWAIAALVVMALGTLAAYVSVSTGQAAGELAEEGHTAAKAVLERHEEMAETTRNLFTALTLMFAMLVVAPQLLRRPLARAASVSVTVIFLALYAGGELFLVNTAHQGGRLVHEFGVRAQMARSAAEPAPAADSEAAGEAGEHGGADEAGEHGEAGERD